jgi:hypothetical protein
MVCIHTSAHQISSPAILLLIYIFAKIEKENFHAHTLHCRHCHAANSVDGVAGNVPTLLAKTFDTVKDATGIDLVDIVNAQSYDAQVNRHVKLDVASLPDMNKQSSQGTELKSNGTPDAPVDKK